MSVRRTVTQSSAGLMLLTALAVAPSAAFGEGPAEAGPGPSDGGCSPNENSDFETTLAVTPDEVDAGEAVTLDVLCFPAPGHGEAEVKIVDDKGDRVADLEPAEAPPGGSGTWTYSVPEGTAPGEYVFLVEVGSYVNNAPFEVIDPSAEPTQPEPDPEPSPDDPPPGDDDGQTPGGDNPDDADPGEGGDDPAPGEDDDEQGGGDPDADAGGQDPDGDGGNSDDGASVDGGQTQDRPEGGESRPDDSAEEESSDKDGETSASDSNQDSASQDPAPQPPAAPGSATNDFPAATPEPSADQKQSAALAALMTSLFANGVSSGEVGTSPDEARTVIDPSADASEIEVPADGASDAGGSSGDSADSGAPDDDGLAATGSTMLVPAGIAGLAILVGAGLKIHQLRRDR